VPICATMAKRGDSVASFGAAGTARNNDSVLLLSRV